MVDWKWTTKSKQRLGDIFTKISVGLAQQEHALFFAMLLKAGKERLLTVTRIVSWGFNSVWLWNKILPQEVKIQ